MSRYIKAKALIDDLLDLAEANKGTYHEEGFKNAITVVEMQPTADVVERRKGKWLKSTESIYRPYMCSNCGCLFDVDTVMDKLTWDFCPACGAQMDERRNNDKE